MSSGNGSWCHRNDSKEPWVRSSPPFSLIYAKSNEAKKIQIPLLSHLKTEYPPPLASEIVANWRNVGGMLERSEPKSAI